MIHVLIRGRNCEKYIHKCLSSLAIQTIPWRGYIVLDNPTDSSYKTTRESIINLNLDDSVRLRRHKRRVGLGYNMFHGVNYLIGAFSPGADDIIAIVDADDTIEPRAFNVVEKTYIKYPECLVTHGSYVKKTKNRKTRVSKPYPSRVDFRKFLWRGSHLKTFKVKLWPHVDANCFRHQGVWAQAASDLALMFPLMELAGRDRVRHIKDPIYIWRDNYRQSTPSTAQKQWNKIIRTKKRLPRLDDDQMEYKGDLIG